MSIERVVKLAELLVAQDEAVRQAEKAYKEAKAAMLRTEREDLPTLMEELGLSEVTLTDGRRVRIKKEVDARITAARSTAALQWLRDNSFGGLIKTEVAVSFRAGDREEAARAAAALEELYDGVTMSEKVHPATLKSFVKGQMAMGAEVPMDLFSVYPYSKAVLDNK